MAEKDEEKTYKGKVMDARAMLEEHAKKGTKIKYRSRKTVIVLKKTKFYKEGQILKPHTVMADQLIKDGIAKVYTEEKK